MRLSLEKEWQLWIVFRLNYGLGVWVIQPMYTKLSFFIEYFFSFRKPRGTKTPKTPSSIKGILKTDSSQVCLIRNPHVVVAWKKAFLCNWQLLVFCFIVWLGFFVVFLVLFCFPRGQRPRCLSRPPVSINWTLFSWYMCPVLCLKYHEWCNCSKYRTIIAEVILPTLKSELYYERRYLSF